MDDINFQFEVEHVSIAVRFSFMYFDFIVNSLDFGSSNRDIEVV